MKVVITSGYFDPSHVGHLRYLQEAKKLGDIHIAIVNNNHQCKLKKGKAFMDEEERCEIVAGLGCVDYAVLSKDKTRDVSKTQLWLAYMIVENGDEVIWAKGGDVVKPCAEEVILQNTPAIQWIYDVGGGKVQSSSKLTGLKAK